LILAQKARYYYGNLLVDDIITTQNDFNKTFSFVVYSKNSNLLPSNQELVINWYFNPLHQQIDGNVSDSEIAISSDYNASNTISGVSVNASIENGKLIVRIRRTNNQINFAVVHLLSNNLRWLWYNKYSDYYDVSNQSSCLEHFCFSITWRDIETYDGVGSGKIIGTESNITDTNSSTLGVKIFR
jgi:hypothetical protein